MATDVLKNFRLRCSLIDLNTRENKGVRQIVIQGYYGNDAVIRLKNNLKKKVSMSWTKTIVTLRWVQFLQTNIVY